MTVVRAWKPSSQSLAGAARSVTVRGAAQADARCRVKPRCEPAPSHSDGAPTASVGEPSQHSVRSSSDISIDPDWYGSCHVVAPVLVLAVSSSGREVSPPTLRTHNRLGNSA